MQTIPSGIRSSFTSPTVSWTGFSVAAMAAGTGAPFDAGSGVSVLMQNQ
jgi:hypothetical protein